MTDEQQLVYLKGAVRGAVDAFKRIPDHLSDACRISKHSHILGLLEGHLSTLQELTKVTFADPVILAEPVVFGEVSYQAAIDKSNGRVVKAYVIRNTADRRLPDYFPFPVTWLDLEPIPFIKQVRGLLGCGLKEARDLMWEFWAALGRDINVGGGTYDGRVGLVHQV